MTLHYRATKQEKLKNAPKNVLKRSMNNTEILECLVCPHLCTMMGLWLWRELREQEKDSGTPSASERSIVMGVRI
eukprot:SAG11_NODE_7312_length_1163_cov_1.250940_1_plen_75_part_00